MKLTLKEITAILQQEIVWCIDHPDTTLSVDHQIGFRNGIRKAIYIIQTAERKLKEANKCVWNYRNIYDTWLSSCEKEFIMIDGTPKENGYNFCPSCGKPLVEFYIQDSEE